MARKDFLTILLLVVPWQITTVFSAPRQKRLSLAENELTSYYNTDIDGYPGTYSFGYNYDTQFRHEQRFPNGTVVGDYGYWDPNGRPHKYRYIADERGYRVMRDRPRRYPATIINYPNVNSQREGEVTWTRKKPNNVQKNRKNGNYFIY